MSRLLQVRIRNYRCFNDHTIDFRGRTIVLGRNNAGKSTLIEAIRLISIALVRFRNPITVPSPVWLRNHEPGPGIRMDLDRIGISTNTIFHRYGDPPAIISANFEDRSSLDLFIDADGDAHAVFLASDGSIVRNKRDARATHIPVVSILPQITPLEREEKILSEEYVKQNMGTHLASRHFRNQLRLLWDENFDRFRELVENTWHGVQIDGLEGRLGNQGGVLQLLVRDGDFVAEAGWMGHGLQMWIQTIWFVTRASDSDTLVLDEPDVYMHPDLQRRLIRFLQKQRPQLIVATHSTEILSEVDSDAVLILDRAQVRSYFAADLPSVQRVIEQIGSAQNLQIAKLWRARSLILVEGDDMKVLKRVFDVVMPEFGSSLDSFPNFSIGGWSGWPDARGSANALRNSVHEDIRCYCLLDSDFHTPDEKLLRMNQAVTSGIQLHILEKKEIENYLLVPSLIRRVILKGMLVETPPPSEDEIREKIDEFSISFHDEVLDCFAQEFFNVDKASGLARANQRARAHVNSSWGAYAGRTSISPGKKILSKLSTWSSESFNVSFGIGSILRDIRRDEVNHELVQFVSAIAMSTPIR